MAEECKCGLGLALSGGGFRASFFHIGVLARLAELDMLRHVEVISTVSGGSIVGAAYYLLLKRMLESQPDADITQQDYLCLVKSLEDMFLEGVQKNLRMRTYVNLLKNIKMLRPDYSRSDRIGELYDEHFYRKALRVDRTVLLADLLVQPAGFVGDFRPRQHNEGRRNKVPILRINATSLNTGRHWRFEAVRMGEPPFETLEARYSASACFNRPEDWRDVPRRLPEMPLGAAVAASACVSGIFHPMAVSDMYTCARIQLVDGGVYDNQGVSGLVEESCKCRQIIVSDASKIYPVRMDPDTGAGAVLLGTTDMLMARNRLLQLSDLAQDYEGRMAYMAPSWGLRNVAVPYTSLSGKPQPENCNEFVPQADIPGLDPEIQSLTGRVRTDLDSFTDVEAFTITRVGFLVAEQELRALANGKDIMPYFKEETRGNWLFSAVAELAEKPTPRYRKNLEVAAQTLFKVMFLDRRSCLIGSLIGLCALFAAVYGALQLAQRLCAGIDGIFSWEGLLSLIAIPILGVGLLQGNWSSAFRKTLDRLPLAKRGSSALGSYLEVAVAVVFGIFVWIYLHTFDRRFLALGKMSRMKE